MSKYKTREDAIKAVSVDGRALAEVDSRFQDDEEIVQIALERGGLLDHASVRIRTDSERIISEVLLGDGFVFNFDKAIFAAKRSFEACQKLTQLYRKSTEFQIEMKLTYGRKYISPIRKLNFFSDDQLRAELYRQKQQIAKENGIEHYIVINALSSTLSFIKESITTNQEFVSLFDITDVDWNKVESGTVAKVKTDVSFPLYEEMKARCDEWVAVIKEALVADDNIALDSTNKLLNAKGTISPKLISNIKNTFPSKNGLYPHEILILREAPRYHFPLGDQFVPAKWYYDYDVNDIEPHLVSLVERGFLTTGNLRTTIEHSTVPVIKRVLTEHKLSTKGKKEELISLLLSSVAEAELLKIFPDKYLILTELGEQELDENSYLFTLQRGTYLSVWTLNRLVNAFPHDSIDTLLYEYERSPRRFLKYLSDEEREYLGITITP